MPRGPIIDSFLTTTVEAPGGTHRHPLSLSLSATVIRCSHAAEKQRTGPGFIGSTPRVPSRGGPRILLPTTAEDWRSVWALVSHTPVSGRRGWGKWAARVWLWPLGGSREGDLVQETFSWFFFYFSIFHFKSQIQTEFKFQISNTCSVKTSIQIHEYNFINLFIILFIKMLLNMSLVYFELYFFESNF
jgi:hypothetical protein